MTGRHQRSWFLVAGYFAAALPILLWAAVTLPRSELVPALGFLTACLVLVNRQVKLEHNVYLPASYSIHNAAMLILLPQAAVLVEALMGLVHAVRLRRPPLRILFNIANFAIPTLLGSLTFRALVPADAGTAQVVAGAIAALVVRFLLNMGTVRIRRALDGEAPLLRGLWEFLSVEGRAWFALRALTLILLLAYPMGGVWTLAIATLLLLVVDDAAQVYITREALVRSARTDGLTQVMNRAAWEEEVARFRPHPAGSHVLFVIDVNGLKGFNDCCGHAEGDRAIKAVASALVAAASAEQVYRFGGDEFVVWLENTQRSAAAVRRVTQAIELLGQTFPTACCSLSASVGAAYAPTDGTTLPELFGAADRRMYEVKRRSKGAPRPTGSKRRAR